VRRRELIVSIDDAVLPQGEQTLELAVASLQRNLR